MHQLFTGTPALPAVPAVPAILDLSLLLLLSLNLPPLTSPHHPSSHFSCLQPSQHEHKGGTAAAHSHLAPPTPGTLRCLMYLLFVWLNP